MKNARKLSIVLLSCALLCATAKEEKKANKIEITGNLLPNNNNKIPEIPKPVRMVEKMTLSQFLDKMAALESGGTDNPYTIVNQYGYLGKYQFSKRTLRGLVRRGYLKASKSELNNFLNDPDLQERAMMALIEHNKDVLLRYGLDEYVGRSVGGVTITMEGMLAGAHLLGPYAVKHYVKTGGSMRTVKVGKVNVRKYDGNGTSIKEYMSNFEYI